MYVLEEVLRFCIEYLVDFIATRHRVWDDKENPSMFDEVFESDGHPQIMSIELRDMAHSFVLQNVELMAT